MGKFIIIIHRIEEHSKSKTIPIGSMYGIFNYMYHKNQPNVGKYPPKPNMEPEHGPLEKEIPSLETHHFQVPAVNFLGCKYSVRPMDPMGLFPQTSHSSRHGPCDPCGEACEVVEIPTPLGSLFVTLGMVP